MFFGRCGTGDAACSLFIGVRGVSSGGGVGVWTTGNCGEASRCGVAGFRGVGRLFVLRGGVGGGFTEGSCESDADDDGGPRGVCGTFEGVENDCRLINCTIGLNARNGLMLRAPRPPFAFAAGGGRRGGSGDGDCVGG